MVVEQHPAEGFEKDRLRPSIARPVVAEQPQVGFLDGVFGVIGRLAPGMIE
jgi:hypothetical protein